MEKDWKLSTEPTGWAVGAPVVEIPSRAEFDALQEVVRVLGMRLNMQSQTITTLSKRLDQALRQQPYKADYCPGRAALSEQEIAARQRSLAHLLRVQGLHR